MNCDSKVPSEKADVLAALESILIITSEPISHETVGRLLGISPREASKALLTLQGHYESGHGFRLVRLGGGWQLASAPEQSEVVNRFREDMQEQPLRLSRAALETLAVVAYKQPVTRGEVEDIRGVRSDKVMETLLRLGLVRVAGRRKGTGTPLLFRTTAHFLDTFILDSISDLPRLEDLADTQDFDEMEEGEGSH